MPLTVDELRALRRRFVKKHGKHAIRRLAAFFGRQSKIGDPARFDPAIFPWAGAFESEWKRVRDEAEPILTRYSELPSFAKISPDQYRIAEDGWKILFFYAFGIQDDDALAACPTTAQLLSSVPGLETAFFSILPPGAYIRPHRGVTKGLVRGHLGLIVPGEPGACRMKLGDDVYPWQAGRLLVFDDTVKHEVWNDTDEHRVILLFDFRRPMRPLGAGVSILFNRGIRLSGYVRDAHRNYRKWKDGFGSIHRPS